MSKTAKIIAAAALGFAAGILLAPKSGKATRNDIKAKAFEKKRQAMARADEVKGRVKDGYVSLRSGVDELELDTEAAEFAAHAKTAGEQLAREAKSRGGRIATKAEKVGRKLQSEVSKNLK